MNDLSYNKYLSGRAINYDNYGLYEFLFNEIAVERLTDIEEVLLAVGSIVNLCGCSVHLAGTRFLIDLVSSYIVKHDFSQSKTVELIARAHRATPEYVIECIRACVKYVDKFPQRVSRMLGIDKTIDVSDISEITQALGAVFKIYYNYSVIGESFDFEKRNEYEKGSSSW